MRIALFHNLPSGGAKRHTLEQVRHLANRGHTIVEYAPSTANLAVSSLRPFVTDQHISKTRVYSPVSWRIPTVTPYIHLLQSYATVRAAARVNQEIAHKIDQEEFDVALVKDCRITMNPYILRYLRTPNVFQCHHGLVHRLLWHRSRLATREAGFKERLKRIYYRPVAAMNCRLFLDEEVTTIRHASTVLSVSEYSTQVIKEQYSVDSAANLPGINTTIFRPIAAEEHNYVLTVGALIERKGHRFLVEALGRMAEDRRPTLFIAANSADENEEARLRALASRLGVRIHIEKIANDQRMVEVYNQARVFVYAPIYEALGMAPLEALACGTPFVAVGEAGVAEALVDGIGGFVVGRDCEHFAEQLELLLQDGYLRRKLGQIGHDYVERRWRWEPAIDDLEDHLMRTAAKH